MTVLSFLLSALFSLLVAFVTYLACKLRIRLQKKWKVQTLGIPEVKGNPFMGNLMTFVKTSGELPITARVLQVVEGHGKLHETSGLFIVTTEPTIANVFVSKVETAEEILSNTCNLKKSLDYDLLKDWLGNGLLVSANPIWRKHRKLLTPAFHFRSLDNFQPIMYRHSQFLVQKLAAATGNNFMEIEKFVASCTLDIIGETALGVNINAQANNESPYSKALKKVTTLLMKRALNPWLIPDFIFKRSSTGKEFAENRQIMNSFLHDLIQERTQILDSQKEDVEYNGCRSFLDMLISFNRNEGLEFTRKDIEDEIQTFAFAGHDTTTSVICWTLYLLGLHLDVQDRVYEEIVDVLGDDSNQPIMMEDLKHFQLLDRVIKETQRLFPAVPMIGRNLEEDFTIGGFTIPKGTNIGIPITVIHQDKRHFPKPEVFDPDRFLETNRHPFAYIPFSAGPRNCIGQRFAMIELKTLLANMLRAFRMTSLDSRDVVLISFETVTRPSIPIRMSLEPRT